MKKYQKNIISIILASLVLFFGWGYGQYAGYNKALKAAGSYPLECGFLTTVTVPCVGVGPVCPPGVCSARSACVPSGEPLYYDVKGTLSGGNPACASGILLSTAVVNSLMLKSGSSLIAGGMGATMMEGGMAASFSGTMPIAMIGFYQKIAFFINEFKNIINV